MEKCNHPDCVNGIMHEEVFPGLVIMRKCEYCVHDEKSLEENIKEIRAKRAALNLQISEVPYGN